MHRRPGRNCTYHNPSVGCPTVTEWFENSGEVGVDEAYKENIELQVVVRPPTTMWRGSGGSEKGMVAVVVLVLVVLVVKVVQWMGGTVPVPSSPTEIRPPTG